MLKFINHKKSKINCRANQLGFILIEVLLVVVILSVSLTVVVHSLLQSYRAIHYASRYARTAMIFEDVLFDLFSLNPKEGSVDISQKQSEADSQYTYDVKINSYTGDGLVERISIADVAVYWNFGSKSKKMQLSTFIFVPEDE